jgi:peptide/nickel transport system permease protein
VLPAFGTGGIRFLILPVITMAFPMSGGIIRIARSGMADTLSEDYIVSTYAKGVGHAEVYLKYALRNAMIPVVTILGMDLGMQLSGAVVVETIFSWTGVGSLLNQSVGNRDYAMVQSMLLISAFFFTSINFLVDIINAKIDPRLTLN